MNYSSSRILIASLALLLSCAKATSPRQQIEGSWAFFSTVEINYQTYQTIECLVLSLDEGYERKIEVINPTDLTVPPLLYREIGSYVVHDSHKHIRFNYTTKTLRPNGTYRETAGTRTVGLRVWPDGIELFNQSGSTYFNPSECE